ncbi:MAG: HRDC domain-containing protein [Akkermansia sp.]|nr:HRDC domain-containing protein [Akkermansia sp.]
MIDNQEALHAWRQRAAAKPQGRTVLDLEADSLHRHREKLCLIQYADEDGVCIIDPLAIEDMGDFTRWLQGADVWMHGADYDMSLFQGAYGVLPHMILDTQIAARLLGFRAFGLAALVEHFYGIVLSKKNQKADWGRRPIPAEMQEYASGDVKFMLEMADKLTARLRELGRHDWFLESCACNMQHGRERFETVLEDPWRIRGAGKLHRRGLAALRALWTWRDTEAAKMDRPAFMVCSNDDLLRWSQALEEFRVVEPRSRMHAQRAARFRKAIEQFQLMDEHDYPRIPKREHHEQDPHFEAHMEHWSAKRDSIAQQLDIEPALIASRTQLEAISNHEDTGLAALMAWQRALLTR